MIKHHLPLFFRVCSLIAGVLLFLFIFRGINIQSTVELLSHIGYSFVVILSLYLIGSIADTFAWKILLESSAQTIPFIRLLLIHIAGESFYRFLPAGVVVGESVKVLLVRKHSSFLYPTIISSLMMRKVLMGISQAFYIGIAVFFGIYLSTSKSNVSLITIGFVVSIGLLILFGAIGYFLYKGNLGASVYKILIKIPIKSFRKKISLQQEEFISTDLTIRKAISTNKRNSVIAFSLFFFGWVTELAETFVILFALTASVAFADSLLFEPIVSFLRSVVFFIPAGLGVMDFGYSSSLSSVTSDTTGTIAAAFVIVKRTKEIFWIIIGVALAAFLGKSGAEKPFFNGKSIVIPNLEVVPTTTGKQ